MSGVHDLSGSVAHRLSGFEERNEVVPSRPGVMATGDRDEAFRGGLGRLACQPFESVRVGVVAGVCERTFRRQIARYEADGLEGAGQTDPSGVDRSHPTQCGRALSQLGIEHIAAYSPEARGRSERAFGTHQQRLPQELAKAGITDMTAANAYLQTHYLPRHNAEFTVPAAQEGSAFVAHVGGDLSEILCEQYERVVGKDNCVRFEGVSLQIPADGVRHHDIKRRVRVYRHLDQRLSLFYGPRRLGRYDAQGAWMNP